MDVIDHGLPALVFAAFAVVSLTVGAMGLVTGTSRGTRMFGTVERAERPVAFWIATVLQLGLGAFFGVQAVRLLTGGPG